MIGYYCKLELKLFFKCIY